MPFWFKRSDGAAPPRRRAPHPLRRARGPCIFSGQVEPPKRAPRDARCHTIANAKAAELGAHGGAGRSCAHIDANSALRREQFKVQRDRLVRSVAHAEEPEHHAQCVRRAGAHWDDTRRNTLRHTRSNSRRDALGPHSRTRRRDSWRCRVEGRLGVERRRYRARRRGFTYDYVEDEIQNQLKSLPAATREVEISMVERDAEEPQSEAPLEEDAADATLQEQERLEAERAKRSQPVKRSLLRPVAVHLVQATEVSDSGSATALLKQAEGLLFDEMMAVALRDAYYFPLMGSTMSMKVLELEGFKPSELRMADESLP